jgi:hypothetical protein
VDRRRGVHQYLHRRQPNHKAGTENAFLGSRIVTLAVAAGLPWRHPVLCQQPAIVGFDDLLGDRQAKTRVLAEILVGPVGLEPLEDFLDCIGSDARPVVIDCD